MLNISILMGRMVADPELKQTQSGNVVTSFRIAVDRSYTPRDQEKQADFIDIVAWRQTAEFICKYFSKGDMIAVTGSIQTRSYQDKQGNKRTAFEVVADKASFCGGKSDKPRSFAPASGDPDILPNQKDGFEVIDDQGDLPF